MKKYKRIAGILLAALAVMSLFPVLALAAGSIDLTQACELTLSYLDGDKSLGGAEFSIYLVATVDETGELTVTKDFEQFNVNIRGENDAAWKTLAPTLEGYVLRDALTPADSGSTDQQGQLTFPTGDKTLVQGLYLVLGSRHHQGGRIYDAQPSLVLLPERDKETDEWIYRVTICPKQESYPEPGGTDTVTRKVLKVWKDQGHEKDRPTEIVVQLLKDGKVYDTVTLNAKNDWRYTWDKLAASAHWTMVEETPEGYTVEITQESITFVVTNTYPETPPEPSPSPSQPGPSASPSPSPSVSPSKPPVHSVQPSPSAPPTGESTLPQTGQLWWPVPLLISAGLLLVVVGLLRRRGYTDGKK